MSCHVSNACRPPPLMPPSSRSRTVIMLNNRLRMHPEAVSQCPERIERGFRLLDKDIIRPMYGVGLQGLGQTKQQGRMHAPPRFPGRHGNRTRAQKLTPIHRFHGSRNKHTSLSSRSRAVSSVGSEHLVYTEGVGGSSPLPPTSPLPFTHLSSPTVNGLGCISENVANDEEGSAHPHNV